MSRLHLLEWAPAVLSVTTFIACLAAGLSGWWLTTPLPVWSL